MVANHPNFPPPPSLDRRKEIGNLPTVDLLIPEGKKIKPILPKEEMSSSSLINMLNPFSEKAKLARAWSNRNIQFGEVYLHALELQEKVIIFQQNIFIKYDAELNNKLYHQNFEHLYGFPDEKLFDKFCDVKWNSKFNVAICLVETHLYEIVNTSYEIAKRIEDPTTAMSVFLLTIETLSKNYVHNN